MLGNGRDCQKLDCNGSGAARKEGSGGESAPVLTFLVPFETSQKQQQ